LEKLLPVVATLLSPLLGMAVRGSRRNRLRRRVDEHLELADKVRAHDLVLASRLEALASEHVDEVVRLDRRSLRKRFDVSTAFAVVLMLVPGVAGIVLALDWDSGWKWPVLALSAFWILATVLGGAGQVFAEPEAESEADDAAAAG
jgi:hypothetical protein